MDRMKTFQPVRTEPPLKGGSSANLRTRPGTIVKVLQEQAALYRVLRSDVRNVSPEHRLSRQYEKYARYVVERLKDGRRSAIKVYFKLKRSSEPISALVPLPEAAE